MEKTAPSGFQHLVQPQTWLCATCPSTETRTGSCAQRQLREPPEKSGAAGFTPPSTEGWILIASEWFAP
jgi:hypothetical protein